MAWSRDGASFWSRLRPRASVDSTSSSSRPVLPMDIWNLLDDFTGVPRVQGRTSRSVGSFLYEVHDMDRFLTDWVWLTHRNREREEEMMPEPVDTAAVLRRCRKVVYKPTPSIWGGKGRADPEQSECAVCLEKLVAKDKLLMLPCNHQFHVDCLTPWIKRNHACCPCCRADILQGPTKGEKKASVSARERNIVGNMRQWANSRGGRDSRIDSAAASNQGHVRESAFRNRSGSRAPDVPRQSADSGEEDTDAWEGLHTFIMEALAEVDAEVNRFMR